MIRRWSIILAVLSIAGLAQSPEAGQYRTKFENDVVAVYEATRAAE